MSKIAIIGSGMMGSALAFPARENGNEVLLIGSCLDDDIISECIKNNKHPKFKREFPKGVSFHYFKDWRSVIDGVDFVIGGVSSFGVEWFLEEVLTYLDPSIPVLTVTKGLIDFPDGRLISYPEYWEVKLKAKGINRRICAVGGPCTSYELVFHDQTEVAFCGKDIATLKLLKEAMKTNYYHISLTTDVVGLESAVALKNGYALGVSMAIGLCEKENGGDKELHFNSQAAVFYQAAREMRKLIKLQGGSSDSESIGLGDLYVTIYGGRTRKVGILLGLGYTKSQALEILEGVTLESLVVAERVARAIRIKASKGELDLAEFPLLLHVDDVLMKGKKASMPWDRFTYYEF